MLPALPEVRRSASAIRKEQREATVVVALLERVRAQNRREPVRETSLASVGRVQELRQGIEPQKSPFNTIPNQSQFQCFSRPCVSFCTSSILVTSIRILVSMCVLS